MPHGRRERFTAHCACGDSIDVSSGHPDTIQFFRSMWEKFHRLDGCRPVGSAEAAAAGRRATTERLRVAR